MIVLAYSRPVVWIVAGSFLPACTARRKHQLAVSTHRIAIILVIKSIAVVVEIVVLAIGMIGRRTGMVR